jgi:uncharacterized membrane protein YhaH (DUF805 family)
MEYLCEFLFGASGRINRAKYWRSCITYSIVGLFAAFILLTAAGLAAPLFVIMAVIIFIPWLLWGLSITTERLHDRDKSAWWLVVFYLVPLLLDQFAKALSFTGAIGTILHYMLALLSLAIMIWGFVEIGLLRGTAGPNKYGPDPLARAKRKSQQVEKQTG